MCNVEKEVLEILQEINENITDDVQIDLLSNGVIDSFDIVNIVAALEVHFKIEFEAEDIVPENFGSVESIVRVEAMLINPFIKLSVTAMVYLLALLYYKKRYGD